MINKTLSSSYTTNLKVLTFHSRDALEDGGATLEHFIFCLLIHLKINVKFSYDWFNQPEKDCTVTVLKKCIGWIPGILGFLNPGNET